jgi:hypothetical protein
MFVLETPQLTARSSPVELSILDAPRNTLFIAYGPSSPITHWIISPDDPCGFGLGRPVPVCSIPKAVIMGSSEPAMCAHRFARYLGSYFLHSELCAGAS